MPTIPDFTVGSTITVAVAIYKNNLKKFFKLSLVAHLWLLVPIYGWARYFAIAAWISRLSLRKLSDKPDSIEREQYFTIGALFLFLSTALITISITVVLGYFLMAFLFTAIAFFLQIILESPILDAFSNVLDKEEGSIYWIIIWSSVLLFSLISTLLYVRLFLTDLGFTEQQNYRVFSLIKHSYLITKSNKLKVFQISWMSFLISLSLYIGVYVVLVPTSIIFNKFHLYRSNLLYYGILCIRLLAFTFANIVLFPFWQSIKAATFYQLTNPEKNYNLR